MRLTHVLIEWSDIKCNYRDEIFLKILTASENKLLTTFHVSNEFDITDANDTHLKFEITR